MIHDGILLLSWSAFARQFAWHLTIYSREPAFIRDVQPWLYCRRAIRKCTFRA